MISDVLLVILVMIYEFVFKRRQAGYLIHECDEESKIYKIKLGSMSYQNTVTTIDEKINCKIDLSFQKVVNDTNIDWKYSFHLSGEKSSNEIVINKD